MFFNLRPGKGCGASYISYYFFTLRVGHKKRWTHYRMWNLKWGEWEGAVRKCVELARWICRFQETFQLHLFVNKKKKNKIKREILRLFNKSYYTRWIGTHKYGFWVGTVKSFVFYASKSVLKVCIFFLKRIVWALHTLNSTVNESVNNKLWIFTIFTKLTVFK